MYTALHFYTEKEINNKLGLIESLFKFFDAEEIWWLVIYERTPSAPGGGAPHEVFRNTSALSRTDAISLLAQNAGRPADIGIRCKAWRKKLEHELANIDSALANDYVPWDVFVVSGTQRIADGTVNQVKAWSKFDVSIGGDGAPVDFALYLEMVKDTPQLKTLREFLGKSSGNEFLCDIVCT